MSFESFLINLASVVEFKGLKPDKHGACLIIMKQEQTPLLFEYDTKIVDGTVLLSSPIGPFNEGNQSFIHQAMKKNHELEETLSLRTHENQIYLHRRLNCEIAVEDLKILIDSFLHQLNLAKEALKQAPSSGALTTEPSQPLLGSHFKV